MISKQLEIELRRQVYTDSYYEFFKWAFGVLLPSEKLEDAFHIKFLCDLYQDEVERIIRREEKTKDIIVNIPPRTSKTLITSVMLNAWAWIKDPTMKFINVSFDDQLVNKNSRDCRDLIQSDAYQSLFGHIVQIRKDVSGVEMYMTTKGGTRLNKTTGSNITGMGAQIIIVDDPQNPKTSESEVMRQTTIDYFTKSLYNRLTPVSLGVRIIVMQRLHENDLSGYLLKDNPSSYRHICLPAEKSLLVKPPELAELYRENLLDPIRLNLKYLLEFKKTLGTRGYAGQYDQTPSPGEGGILRKEWFEVVRPETLKRDVINEPIHFFIDSAYTEKTENDPTAILTGFKQNNMLYVLDVKEVWLEFPQLIQFIIKYTSTFQYNNQSKIFIEPKASGKSIAQQLRAMTMLNIIEMQAPKDDKVTRAHGIAPICESRRVKLVDGSYIPNFVEQLGTFPNATHDDMVDDLVNAVNELLVETGPDFAFV